MSKQNGSLEEKIARAIGATSTKRVSDRTLGTPLSWLYLAHELKSRFVSSGGRPSDPNWDIRRTVPFRREVWEHLTSEAKAMCREGIKVGPAQLAAVIIENSVGWTESESIEPKVEVDAKTSNLSYFHSYETEGAKARSLTRSLYLPLYPYASEGQSEAPSDWLELKEIGNVTYSITRGNI